MKSIVLALCLASVARAEKTVEAEKEAAHGIAPFALLVEVGQAAGVSAGAQLSMGRLGLRALGGWNPVTILASDPDTFQARSFHIFSTGQLTADAFALPFEGTPGVLIGVAGGYRYNTLLGHGFGAGVEIQIARSRHVGWHIHGGLNYFPDGESNLIREKHLPADSQFNFPFGAGLQGGVSFGIALIP